MAPDTGAVDTAVLELLRADAALLALCPDGIQWGVAERDAARFVLVARDDHENVGEVFGGAPFGERFVYLVAATLPEATSANARAAAARIRELLEGRTTLAAVGYGLQAPIAELASVRPDPDVDPQNADRRVQQWGGRYQIHVQRING